MFKFFKRVQVDFRLLKCAVVCCNFLQSLRLLFSRVRWLWVFLGCLWMRLVVLGFFLDRYVLSGRFGLFMLIWVK